jgi:hypothetical protein
MEAEDFYEKSLNIEIPESLSDLKGSGGDALPDFLSGGFFTYTVEHDYFTALGNHTDFLEENILNKSISSVSCDAPDFPDEFGFWTDIEISFEDKECYTGVYYPYIHYLIYDPDTNGTLHFVSALRD